MNARYQRSSEVLTRWFEGEAFVITPAAIQNLAGISAIVWRKLARARSEMEITAALQKLYPQIEPQRIASDVQSLISQLKLKKLVVNAT